MTEREREVGSGHLPIVNNPERLAAVRHLQATSPNGPMLDQLARSAAAALGAPIAALVLIDEAGPYLLGSAGIDRNTTNPRLPATTAALWSQTVEAGTPLLIGDFRRSGYQPGILSALTSEVGAFAAVPLATSAGVRVGTLAVVDRRSREWCRAHTQALSELAALATMLLDRHSLTDTQQQEVEQLKQQVAGHAQVFSVAAHELRTPLTSLLGNIHLLQRVLDSDSGDFERARRLTGIITGEVSRLDAMIETLLDLSRLQTGKLRLQREPTELRGLLKQLVERMQQRAEGRKLTLTIPDTALIVEGSPQRLEQIFEELITNALTYSPVGGAVEVSVTRQENVVVVAVSDQGIGIPEEDIPRLFAPFHRGSNTRLMRASGMGIGLYLARELIRLHDGTIEVDSTEFEGSTFTIRLPIFQGGAAPPRGNR